MSLKARLLAALPPFKNEKRLIVQTQGTDDIKKEIFRLQGKYETDYDSIYHFFDTGDLYRDCKGIWDFLKQNLVYKAETKQDQSVKSPAAILQSGEYVDCKHYALFAGGVLDAIRVHTGAKWQWFYRFVSDKSKTNVSHVFVVATDGKSEYWIDPCLTNFNQRRDYTLTEDWEAEMPLYEISGVNDAATGNTPTFMEVDKTLAYQRFLSLMNLNYLKFKDLLLAYPDITNSEQVKQYFEQNGFDYNQFLRFVNS